MVRLSDFALDVERMDHGAWVDWAGTGIGFRIRLADARPTFVDRLREGYRDHPDWRRDHLTGLFAGGTMVDALEEDERAFWASAIAEELVTDWRGVTADEGDEPVDYSPEELTRSPSRA